MDRNFRTASVPFNQPPVKFPDKAGFMPTSPVLLVNKALLSAVSEAKVVLVLVREPFRPAHLHLLTQ